MQKKKAIFICGCCVSLLFTGIITMNWRMSRTRESFITNRGDFLTSRKQKFYDHRHHTNTEEEASFNLNHSLQEYWMQQSVHLKTLADKNYIPISREQAQQVEKFLFFTGYPRSGHSIVGSLLDAHPNITLSYAFFLFRRLLNFPEKKSSIEALLRNKTLFYNALHERSYHYSRVSSNKSSKGYTLDIPGMWSGRFNHLKIIGDKSALPTTIGYSSSSPKWFKERYNHLEESLGVPLVGLHVVRNPFDMIATHMLYKALSFSWKQKHGKETWSKKNKLNDRHLLQTCVNFFFDKAKAVEEMIPLCHMSVLEIHNEDLVMAPRKEVERVCEFLDVECSDKYLSACENKVYKTISRTRDKILWPRDIQSQVEEKIQEYSFFRGYTFEGDFYSKPL